MLIDSFSNFNIRRKLLLFSAMYVVLTIIFIIFIGYFSARVGANYSAKGNIYKLIRFIQNLRVREKNYLQYYDDACLEPVQSARNDILTGIDHLYKFSVNAERLNVIRQYTVEHTRMLTIVRNAHATRLKLLQEVNDVVEDMQKTYTQVGNCIALTQFAGNDVLKEVIQFQQTVASILWTVLTIKDIYQRSLLDNTGTYSKLIKFSIDGKFEQFHRQFSSVPRVLQVPALNELKNLLLKVFTNCYRIPKIYDEAFAAEVEHMAKLEVLDSYMVLNADLLLAEAERRTDDDKRLAFIVAVAVCVSVIILALFFGFLMSHFVTRAINVAVTATEKLLQGNLTTRIKVYGNDEVGQLAAAFNAFIERLQKIIHNVDENTKQLALSATHLSETSDQMSRNASCMNEQVFKVASTGKDLSSNIVTMAASAAQISTSADNVTHSIKAISANINAVSKNCNLESKIATAASKKAQEARDLVSKLGSNTAIIRQVTDVINTIAEQTNLLALNATIEAASAGNASEGFGVVANEVKALASKSSDAAKEISNQVLQIQDDTSAAVSAINVVAAIIEEVSHIAEQISLSVRAQTLTVNEIAKTVASTSNATNILAKNIQESAQGASDVAENIQGVSRTADTAATGALATSRSAQELSQMASRLKLIVQQFKV